MASLQIAAALIVLFEEWGWRPLAELLGWLSRFRPWAMLELWIAGLPPYAALLVFALPTTILLPLKFVSVWLLASGFLWSAGALFLAAKIASTALIARIFMLTKPALMSIAWFARAYNWFMPWKEVLFAQIRASWPWRYGRMVKIAIRHEAKQAWARLKPRLLAAWSEWKPWLAGQADMLLRAMRVQWARWQPRVRLEAQRMRLAVVRVWHRVRGA
jgi:hypothetical protein